MHTIHVDESDLPGLFGTCTHAAELPRRAAAHPSKLARLHVTPRHALLCCTAQWTTPSVDTL
jgi:hypothetical protein